MGVNPISEKQIEEQKDSQTEEKEETNELANQYQSNYLDHVNDSGHFLTGLAVTSMNQSVSFGIGKIQTLTDGISRFQHRHKSQQGMLFSKDTFKETPEISNSGKV